MNIKEMLHTRLYNQRLASKQPKEVHDVVSWMGAMQSQALDMAKWGIGARLPHSSVEDINNALNSGQIIRTHILRPTWHFVSANDIHWMFDLSNPRLKTIYHSYGKTHGTDHNLILNTVPLVERALRDGQHLSKQELCDYLHTQGIDFDTRHMTMVIEYAEMEGVLCNGKLQDNKQTFTLLEEWAPRKQTLCKEEALERLARRYFNSHGPATINDFVWWSGLSLTECRKGLEAIKQEFICSQINGRDFWMKNDISIPDSTTTSALLLPQFDEFVVGYKDRSDIIEDEHYPKVMTKNGLFSPTIMLNGEIIGSWKKTVKKSVPQIELSFFEKESKKVIELFKAEKERVEHFYS